MGEAKRRGSYADRLSEALNSDQFLELDLDHPLQFVGYKHQRPEVISPFEIENNPACLVSYITPESLKYISDSSVDIKYKVGDWFCSVGDCSELIVHGPFSSMQDAMNFGSENFGVTRFIQLP